MSRYDIALGREPKPDPKKIIIPDMEPPIQKAYQRPGVRVPLERRGAFEDAPEIREVRRIPSRTPNAWGYVNPPRTLR